MTASASRRAFCIAVVATLAVYNVVVNELLPNTFHGIAAVVTALGLLLGAARVGLTRAELGLERQTVRRGLRWGAATSLVVAAAITSVAIIPATRTNLDDAAIGELSIASLAWEVLVRIPSVTAGFEELAFRSVLLAALIGPMTTRAAVVVQALLFGAWHILPTLGPDGGWADVGITVTFTTVAGLFFAFLQLRTRSLIAPYVLHAMTNGTATIAAWMVAN